MYPLLLSKGGVGVRGVSCVPSSPLKPRTIKVEISNEHWQLKYRIWVLINPIPSEIKGDW